MASGLPRLPASATRRPDGPRYREQYGVILVCPDEASQQQLYAALQLLGRVKLKVVST